MSLCPAITSRSSSVNLPHFILSLPFSCFHWPRTCSQFMRVLLQWFEHSPSLGRYRKAGNTVITRWPSTKWADGRVTWSEQDFPSRVGRTLLSAAFDVDVPRLS